MASTGPVKEEFFRPLPYPVKVEQSDSHAAGCDVPVVEISSSSSSEDHAHHLELQNGAAEVTSPLVSKRANSVHTQTTNGFSPAAKRPRVDANGSLGDMHRAPVRSREDPDAGLPDDFLQPLGEIHPTSVAPQAAVVPSRPVSHPSTQTATSKVFRQFWKAGDYDGEKSMNKTRSGGMDHVRVHPKFLHSNATSHKWTLGAVAELLDNALDEVVHGATFVKVDMITNPKNGEPMLLIEDDGGGMSPDNMRQCMSLGYSAKSKIANTIGQYGNGFKTSTMRLGADVIVFSRCQDSKGPGPTESVGMLSYTFLRETGQEDIIVPMIDYEIQPFGLRKLIRSNVEDWNRNMESVKRWSPYASEAELLDHFKGMKKQGTKIIVFNLWEDDQGQLELDFVTDPCDIQVRGANRDEKQISMAERFPNSRHYLTYQHSLRSYASILYLRLPSGFRMYLRGKEIDHHNLIDDLMFTEVLTYRPVGSDVQRDTGQMKAVVTVGFVKDAKEHIDVQGFNVYHKNRLIKPFWRLWNSAASRGRGIIGVLEANFVEPAHDKQGFERTIVLARLESRLLEMQKTYWSKHCHKVGYVNNTLKGKDGRTSDPKGASSSGGDTMHPAPVVSRSIPLPVTPSPVRLPMQAGNPSGVHAPSVVGIPAGYPSLPSTVAVPLGLARSIQLQKQVQGVRHEHCGQEVHSQALRQVGSQALPMSVGMRSLRPREFSNPTVNQNETRALVVSSTVQNSNTQTRERLPGQLFNATRSPLPPPASSSSQTPHVQPEPPRRVMPSSGPFLVSPLRPHVSQAIPTISRGPSSDPSLVSPSRPLVSQAIPTNHVSPSGRSKASISNDTAAPVNVVQDASMHHSIVTGNVSTQPPGPGLVEAVKAAATPPQSVEQNSSRVQGTTSGNNHNLQNVTPSPEIGLQSSNISTRRGRDNGQICEKEIGPAVVDTVMVTLQMSERDKGPSDECLEPVEAQVDGHAGGLSEQNRQRLSNTGSLSVSVRAEALPVVLEGPEAESSKSRPAEDTLKDWRAESTLKDWRTESRPAEDTLKDRRAESRPAEDALKDWRTVSTLKDWRAESRPAEDTLKNRRAESRPAEGVECRPAEDTLKDQRAESTLRDWRMESRPAEDILKGGRAESRPAEDILKDWRSESTCAPPVIPSCNLPSTTPLSNPGASRAAHTPPEQSSLRAPRLSNKDAVLGRKSLEDLGRMFARKAATIATNRGEQVNKLMDPDAKAIEPFVTEYCPLTNKELETHLVEMELEVEKLHDRLLTLTVERDNLRQQLLEERLQGEQKKQELQKKVEQTWAKVRELEAQNERLRSAQH